MLYNMGGRMKLWDPRGVLAIAAVFGAFLLQGFYVYTGSDQELPAWVVGLVSTIVVYYFGSKNGNGNGKPPVQDQKPGTSPD